MSIIPFRVHYLVSWSLGYFSFWPFVFKSPESTLTVIFLVTVCCLRIKSTFSFASQKIIVQFKQSSTDVSIRTANKLMSAFRWYSLQVGELDVRTYKTECLMPHSEGIWCLSYANRGTRSIQSCFEWSFILCWNFSILGSWVFQSPSIMHRGSAKCVMSMKMMWKINCGLSTTIIKTLKWISFRRLAFCGSFSSSEVGINAKVHWVCCGGKWWANTLTFSSF